MGYQYDDEDEDDFEFEDEPQGQNRQEQQVPAELRKAYKSLQRKYKKLEGEYATLRTDSARTALSEVLKDRGLRPGLARHMLRDNVDPGNKRAVDDWLEDNAEDFGIDLNGSSSGGGGSNNDRATNFVRMQNAERGALPAESRAAELERRIKAAKDAGEINAILAEAGPFMNS